MPVGPGGEPGPGCNGPLAISVNSMPRVGNLGFALTCGNAAAAFSNPIGASEVALPIPPTLSLAGVRFFTQFVWFGPSAPPPCPPLGLSSTHSLDVTIQW